MSYSYDYLQARLADHYDEADHRRLLASVRQRPGGGRIATFMRRRRHDDELGGCTD